MRVCSLKTRRSIARHGNSFHSYAGPAVAFMTCPLLLAPLSSRQPRPRQLVPGITLGLCFLDDPSSLAMQPDRLLHVSTTVESTSEVIPFPATVWRSRRPQLSTGHRL